jgi:hypothetical protein
MSQPNKLRHMAKNTLTRRGMLWHRDRAGSGNAAEAEDLSDPFGFFDLAIAAPSMKATLEAWGHQGAARETDDPVVVAATMSKPGGALKRAAGSNGRFTEHLDLRRRQLWESERKRLGEALRRAREWAGNVGLTVAIPLRKKIFDTPLKLSSAFQIFSASPSRGREAFGSRDVGSGAGRCPEPARTHLAPRRIWI